jgi:acetyltransferase-like isoleucine patch superfamily enzyme
MKQFIREVFESRSKSKSPDGEQKDAKENEKSFYMQNNPKYSNYEIGRFTYGEPLVLEWGEEMTLKVGSFCSIAPNVTILLGGNHRGDWITTFPFNIIFEEFRDIEGHPSSNGNVTIGNDVWIGLNTVILSGVVIGDGAIIGANSLVAKDVEPYSVAGGNPAKKIKNRFNDKTINDLLRIKWWDWDLEKIKNNIPLMLSADTQLFLDHNAD